MYIDETRNLQHTGQYINVFKIQPLMYEETQYGAVCTLKLENLLTVDNLNANLHCIGTY